MFSMMHTEALESRRLLAAAVAGVGGGLVANFFSDQNESNLAVTRNDPTVNFDWGADSPDPQVPIDHFSARWVGRVQAQYSETYTFYTTSNDGVRLWVNGQKLIDHWNAHATTENSGTIALSAGESYDIKLEYFDDTGDATVKLAWS